MMMKAQLRDHVRVKGDTTRSVEVARIDWQKRVVFLDDGRWIPFEMVAIGDAEPEKKLGPFDKAMIRMWTPVQCERCARVFDNSKQLGGHRRHCKGRTQ